MHQIPAKQAAAETVALEGTPELDAGSAGRYSPSLNNEGERTMRLLGRFLLVMTLLGQFVVSALCQQAQSSGATGSTSNAATLPAAPVINPINSSPSTTTSLQLEPAEAFPFQLSLCVISTTSAVLIRT